MEDSPLSIAASIAGILTFFAAVLAFVYVRFNTIRDGQAERLSIMESTAASLRENHALLSAFIHLRLDPEAPAQPRSFSLLSELLATELVIKARCWRVHGETEAATMERLQHNEAFLTQLWSKTLSAEEAARRLREFRMEVAPTKWDKCFWAVSWPPDARNRLALNSRLFSNLLYLLAFGLLILITLGSTPASIHWYIVRDKVMELVQRRETLRSQLLFHQISEVSM